MTTLLQAPNKAPEIPEIGFSREQRRILVGKTAARTFSAALHLEELVGQKIKAVTTEDVVRLESGDMLVTFHAARIAADGLRKFGNMARHAEVYQRQHHLAEDLIEATQQLFDAAIQEHYGSHPGSAWHEGYDPETFVTVYEHANEVGQ